MTPPPQGDAQPLATQLALNAAAGALILALLPGVVFGIATAEYLRHRALRWTWALLAAPPLAATAPFAPQAIHRIATLDLHDPTVATIARAGALPWIWTTLPACIAFKLYRDRRDRLHGGAAEQRLINATGPIFAARLALAARRTNDDDPGDGILLGHDQRNAPVRLPRLRAHATIVGGSDTGKTNTAQILLEGHVAHGSGFVILDGKGGRGLPRTAVALGRRYGRPVTLWSVNPYGDPVLDAHRLPWNPVGEGTPTEVKDRIASSEEQTEPYFKAIASRGLLIAAQVIAASGPVRLDALAGLLDAPARIPTPDLIDAAWLKGLNDGERSALRGIATRIRTMVAGDGGTALLPAAADQQLKLSEAIRNGHLVVFTLPEGEYPELIPHVGRYLLQALISVCSHLERDDEPADSLVFFDEVSTFEGDQLAPGFERGRSAGVRFIVATQSLSNFETAGGPKLLHAVLDNAELLIIHRQAVPDAVELLASVAGTEEAWEHTHAVSDMLIGTRISDETGERARRLTDRFRAHPNIIKKLGMGEAVVISHRPSFAVRPVRVRQYKSRIPAAPASS